MLIVTENLIPVRELRSSNTFNPILYLDTGDVKISSLILSTLNSYTTPIKQNTYKTFRVIPLAYLPVIRL